MNQLTQISALLFSSLLLMPATAQDIRIRAVDGKSGKPIANHRLLVFLFDKTDNSSRYRRSVDVYTDGNGIAILHDKDAVTKYLELRVDFETLCASGTAFVESSNIRSHGISLENNCNAKIQSIPEPNEVIVDARSPTLRERMNW